MILKRRLWFNQTNVKWKEKKMVKTIKPTFLVFSNTFIVYVCFYFLKKRKLILKM